MSWGEISCIHSWNSDNPCPIPDEQCCTTCNCECSHYIWDGETEPDSIMRKDYPIESHFKEKTKRKKNRNSRRK